MLYYLKSWQPSRRSPSPPNTKQFVINQQPQIKTVMTRRRHPHRVKNYQRFLWLSDDGSSWSDAIFEKHPKLKKKRCLTVLHFGHAYGICECCWACGMMDIIAEGILIEYFCFCFYGIYAACVVWCVCVCCDGNW